MASASSIAAVTAAKLLVEQQIAFNSIETRESTLEDIFVGLLEDRQEDAA